VIRHPPLTQQPIAPTSEAELFQNHGKITSCVTTMISQALHETSIKSHITKRAGWTDRTFQQVDWQAHNQAFSSYRRVPRLRLIKLVYGLYHTNYQACKMYGTSDLCPCCHSQTETLVSMLLHGISSWEQSQFTPNHPSPLYCGSVSPADIHLIQAFQEQMNMGPASAGKTGPLLELHLSLLSMGKVTRTCPHQPMGKNCHSTYMSLLLHLSLEIP